MRRRRDLRIDPLERRDLLSITPLINSPGWVQGPTGGSVHVRASGASQATLDPATGTYVNNNLGGSGFTTDITPPRPDEAARRLFTASFSGRVQELPPRLLDQARQFYILGPGTSTGFLHGTAQVRYYTPVAHPVTFPDPTQPGAFLTELPTSTTGTISMSDRSTQSGAVLLANLVGSRTDVDRLGRPTHFTFALNGGGGSGGIYASSVGSGTVDLVYHGNRATIKVRARITISGVGNPLDIFQSNSHH